MDHNYISLKHERLTCEQCGSQFSKKFNLNKHMRNFCKGVMKEKNYKCPNCSDAFLTKKEYLGHLKTAHNLYLEQCSKHFENLDEFYRWKLEEEKATITKFISYKTDKFDDGSRKLIYRCHRDGFFKTESSGKRSLKKLGSNKINGHCPAKMIVEISPDGSCVLEYIFTHIGHDFEIQRLTLSKAERDELARKLSQKIPLDVILDEVRDSPVDKNISRVHLLTKKDLFNIVNRYKLNKNEVKYKENHLSLDAWVKLMQSSANNVVRFYKPQGHLLKGYTFLEKDDFVLIVFNDAQLDILKEYGNDVVCIDRTHGLDDHDFELFSVLVLDDTKQGFPVAFMISNRCDPTSLALFFQIIKTRLGEPLRTKIFMSDMAEEFFLVWSSVMSSTDTVRLYCSWHVDREWKANLNKIRTQEKEASVYKSLKVLAMQSNELDFKQMSRTFLKDLYFDADCEDFAQYIQSFIDSPETWAYCYRKNAGFNSNSNLESLHRSLKHVYLKGKSDRRLDRGIQAVMGLVRDKLYNRFVTLSKDKITKKLSVLRDRHNTAVKSTLSGIEIESGASWIVSSSAGKDHTVQVNHDKFNSCSCFVRCTPCNNACIHEYSCTCIDYLIKWNMCKHIHYVIFNFNPSGGCSESLGNMDEDTLPEPNDDEVCYEIASVPQISVLNPEQALLEHKKEECRQFFESVLQEIETDEQLEACLNYIAPLQSVIQAAKPSFGDTALNITINNTSPSSSTKNENTTAKILKIVPPGSSSPKKNSAKRKYEDAEIENPTNEEVFFIEKILKGEYFLV